jgi:hypothetical protein
MALSKPPRRVMVGFLVWLAGLVPGVRVSTVPRLAVIAWLTRRGETDLALEIAAPRQK